MTDLLITRDLRYQYDQREHLRLAEDLAHEITTLAAAVKLFETAKAAHKEAVARMESTIRDLSRKLSEGWEIRDVVCRLLPNDPEAGKRTIMRVDTGEVVAIEDMHTGAPVETPPPDKLFEILQTVADQLNSGALDTGDVKCTAQVSSPSALFDPKAEASAEEKKRSRKKLRGQDAILPDPRKPSEEKGANPA